MLNDLFNSEALKAGKDLVSPMLSLQQRLINFLINFINLILICLNWDRCLSEHHESLLKKIVFYKPV